jgi:hypothetical protein
MGRCHDPGFCCRLPFSELGDTEMSKYDNYSGSPYFPGEGMEYDDTKCFHCGAELPNDPQEGTPQWDGFCSEKCRTDNKDGIIYKPWAGVEILDAYGHLSWTVGNDDWLACFDADISPDGKRYAYHVVVDCESGGFTETPESGEGDIENIDNLRGLADYWYGIFTEVGYIATEEDDADFARVHKAWNEHIDHLKASAQKRRASNG